MDKQRIKEINERIYRINELIKELETERYELRKEVLKLW